MYTYCAFLIVLRIYHIIYAIDMSFYLPCIQPKNQNDVAYGCQAATIILRQPPILKSHGYNTSHFMRKIFFSPISVFKTRIEDKFKSG